MAVIQFKQKKARGTADAVIEDAAGRYAEVLVIGYDQDGNMEASLSNGLIDGGELLWLLENFKHKLLAGDFME